MKRFVFAALLFAAPASAQQSVMPSFDFAVIIEGRRAYYNDAIGVDQDVFLPQTSPWRCTRKKLVAPAPGVVQGAFSCTSDYGRTRVLVSATCGPAGALTATGTATLGADHEGFVTLSVDCSAVPAEVKLGF